MRTSRPPDRRQSSSATTESLSCRSLCSARSCGGKGSSRPRLDGWRVACSVSFTPPPRQSTRTRFSRARQSLPRRLPCTFRLRWPSFLTRRELGSRPRATTTSGRKRASVPSAHICGCRHLPAGGGVRVCACVCVTHADGGGRRAARGSWRRLEIAHEASPSTTGPSATKGGSAQWSRPPRQGHSTIACRSTISSHRRTGGGPSRGPATGGALRRPGCR